jgi:CRP-like cAMP-binding protein
MRNHQSCDACDLERCFLLKNCDSKWHKEMQENTSCVLYSKQQHIFRQGDSVLGLYFIQSGKIKVYKETNYRRQIIRIAKDGDILGHRGVIGESKYPISASSIGDSRVCYIEQDVLFKLMQQNAMLSIEMMHFYADELKKTETRLRNMSIMTVRERVADALLLIYDAFGTENGGIIGADFSRQDIADIAGTYAEQVSRFIKEFKNEQILTLIGKHIELKDSSKLREIVEKYDKGMY